MRNPFYESCGMNAPEVRPRILLFTAKLGYQTRAFDAGAKKLGVELVFITDRCHQLDDPWNDRAVPVRFEAPEEAAYAVMQAQAGQNVEGVLALGDRPTRRSRWPVTGSPGGGSGGPRLPQPASASGRTRATRGIKRVSC